MTFSDGAAWAVIVVAMASCTAATTYFEKPVDPRLECVKRAWLQKDRIDCLTAAIRTEPTSEAEAK